MKNIFLISYFFFLSNLLFSQGGDNTATASTAGNQITLPFSSTGTTIGKVNDYNFPVGFNDWSTAGPDWMYYFCAPSTGKVHILLTNVSTVPALTSSESVYASISLWTGTPGAGGTMLGNTVEYLVSTSEDVLELNVTAGTCYYIMIDNMYIATDATTRNGFNYNLSIQMVPTDVLQPACTNIDFESGSLTGWSGSYGHTITAGVVGAPIANYTPAYYGTNATDFSITSGAGVDVYGGFPVVCPGFGTNSVILGDLNGTNYGGASLEQKFTVTTSNALFTYKYAAVLNDGGHTDNEQPFFQAEIKDCNGNSIACGKYTVTAGVGAVGFTLAPGTTDVYYKTWTPVFVDLTAYIGTCVTVKFIVGDCSNGAHFGYAYIDAICAPMVITGPISVCPNSPAILTSPIGGTSYAWSVVGNATVLGTAQSLNIASVTTAATYQCVITSATGCSTTLTFAVNLFPPVVATTTSTMICQGTAGSVIASATPIGGSFLWPGGITTTSFTMSPSVTTPYICTYTDLNGCSDTAKAIFTVNPLPPVPVVSPISICINGAVSQLTATAAAGCTLNWYATAVSVPALGSAPTPSNSVSSTYYVSQTSASGCEGPRVPLVVTINPLPIAPVVVPISICENGAVSPLTATASAGCTLNWYTTAISVPSLGSAPTPSNSVSSTYYVSQTSASGCEGPRVPLVVTINPLPLAPVVAPITLCANDVVSPLTAVTAAGCTLNWYATAISVPALGSAPTPSNTVSSTYYVSQTSGLGCEGPRVPLVVTVNPLPVAPVVTPITICENGAVSQLTATTAAGCTLNWYATAVSVPALGSAPTPSNTVSSTYYVSQTSALGCEGSRVPLVVTINPLPIAPVVVPISLCFNDAISQLTATAAVGCTLNWYTTAISVPSLGSAPTPSNTVSSTYYVSQTSASGCEGPRVPLLVTVNPLPVVTVNSPTICPTIIAVLTANGAVTYSWNPGASTSNPYSVSPISTTTYTVTGTDANSCVNTATAIVTVSNSLTVTVNSPTICNGESTILTANGGATYLWSGGEITNTITVSPTATTSYTVTGTTNGCFGTATSIVTVNPLPIAPVVVPIVICENDVVSQLTATAATGCTLNWYATAISVPALGSAPTPSNTVSSTYYVSQTSASGCEGPKTPLVVTINSLPIITVNSPTICPTTTAVLTAAGAVTYSWSSSGSTLNPYSVSPNVTTTYTVIGTDVNSCKNSAIATVTLLNNLVMTVNSPTICIGSSVDLVSSGSANCSWSPTLETTTMITVSPLVTTSYVVTGTTNGCIGTATAIVTVNPIPLIPTVSPIQYCLNEVTIPLTATASAGCTLTWYGTNSTLGSPSLIAPTPSSSIATTTIYYVSQTNNLTGCEGPRVGLSVIINPLPLAPIVSPVVYCQNDVAVQLTATSLAGCTLKWYSVNQNGGIFTLSAPTPNTSVSTVLNYYVSQVNTLTGCEGPTTLLLVTINPTPVTPAVTSVTYCLHDVSTQLVASSLIDIFDLYALNWYGQDSIGGSSSSVAPIPSTAVAGIFYYYVSQTNLTTGCEGPRAKITVVVNDPTIISFPSVNPICEGSIAPILNNFPPSNPSITGSWNPSSVSTTIVGPTSYVFTPSANQCALPASVTITILPLPILLITNPADVCEPNTVNITLPSVTIGSSSGSVPTYWKNASATIPLLNPTAINVSGVYFIKNTLQGCSTISPVTVAVHPLPIANFTPSPNVISSLNPVSSMINTSMGAMSYTWSFGDGGSSILTDPKHIFPETNSGSYTIVLTAVTEFGCVDVTEGVITIKEELLFYVPNTFTPDKDSYNETFLPVFTSGFDPYEFTLLIFNRWGQIVFESHDASIGWNGTFGADGELAQDDTYTWKILYKLKDSQKVEVVVGHVNVLR